MSNTSLQKIASAQCSSSNIFHLYGEDTNYAFTDFLEKLMKSYRKSKQYECQHLGKKLEDEVHFETLHQFILNLSQVQ